MTQNNIRNNDSNKVTSKFLIIKDQVKVPSIIVSRGDSGSIPLVFVPLASARGAWNRLRSSGPLSGSVTPVQCRGLSCEIEANCSKT